MTEWIIWNIFHQNDWGIESEDRKKMKRMIEGKCPDTEYLLTLVGGFNTLEILSVLKNNSQDQYIGRSA